MAKNGIAAMIVKGLGKPSDEEEVTDSEGMSDEEMLADDIMSAIKANDSTALVDALKSFIETCSNGKEEEYEEETN